MVSAETARADIDKYCLTKIITYRQYVPTVTDLTTEETSPFNYRDFKIKAQVTVQNVSQQHVSEGLLMVGDLIGLLRYKYTEDYYGTPIEPALVPKIEDEIIFNSQRFVITTCTPATSEENDIIAWDITAKQAGMIPDDEVAERYQ